MWTQTFDSQPNLQPLTTDFESLNEAITAREQHAKYMKPLCEAIRTKLKNKTRK